MRPFAAAALELDRDKVGVRLILLKEGERTCDTDPLEAGAFGLSPDDPCGPSPLGPDMEADRGTLGALFVLDEPGRAEEAGGGPIPVSAGPNLARLLG